MNGQAIKLLFLICLIGILQSCGFKPAYQRGEKMTALSSVQVAPQSTAYGAEYYSHLKNIISSQPPHNYTLESKLTFSKDYDIIQKNSDVLRELLTLKTEYVLRNINTGKIELSGQFSRFVSYNTTFSPYSTTVEADNLNNSLSIIAAEETRDRLILFFNRKSQ